MLPVAYVDRTLNLLLKILNRCVAFNADDEQGDP